MDSKRSKRIETVAGISTAMMLAVFFLLSAVALWKAGSWCLASFQGVLGVAALVFMYEQHFTVKRRRARDGQDA